MYYKMIKSKACAKKGETNQAITPKYLLEAIAGKKLKKTYTVRYESNQTYFINKILIREKNNRASIFLILFI